MRMGRPARIGLVGVTTLAIAYPLIEARAAAPLAMFVLAPLGVAVVGDHRDTRTVAVAAFLVAAVEGWVGDMDPAALLARLVIVAVGSALAVVGARVRSIRERELRDSEVQRTVLAAFQEGLVPVPTPPRGILAVSGYRPAQVPLRIGGDFVDVISLPDGTAGFIIGDVCGHGPRAAAFGARVRAAWKGVARTIPLQPERWLEELDHAFFDDRRFDGFVTALAGRLTLGGEVSASCAGHPPPILWSARCARAVELRPDVPLGIDTSARRRTAAFPLPPASSMLLYTDGLVENSRTPGGRAGEEGLLTVLSRERAPVTIEELLGEFGPDGFDDDVAVLQLRLGESPATVDGRGTGL